MLMMLAHLACNAGLLTRAADAHDARPLGLQR